MNFRKRFKIGQLIKVGEQRKKGQVIDITNHLITVQFENYRESFSLGQLIKPKGGRKKKNGM